MPKPKKSPFAEEKDKNNQLSPITDITAAPLRGGCNTSIHKALIPFGGFSMLQNIRGDHPGFRKRPGQIELHPTADSTNEILSLYQFRKNRIDEKHFFAQMADGDILDAATAPPGIASTVFGTETFSGSAGQIPAAWSVIDDILFHSNGVDQHKIYTGDDNYVSAFVVHNSTHSPANIPEIGLDYTSEATDGLTTTTAILDSFGPTALAADITAITKAAPGVVSSIGHGLAIGDVVYFTGLTEMTELNGTLQTVTAVGSADLFSINDTSAYGSAETTGGACGFNASPVILICTPVPATKLTWTIPLPNNNASVGKLYYKKSDNAWADTSMTDGTISSAKTLGQAGSMTWTAPTDEIPFFMYGQSGFWYMFRVTIALDSEVEVSKLTFGSGFHDIVNVWDSVVPYAVEAMLWDNSASAYRTYASGSVELDNMAHTDDKLYFNSADPIIGIYIDVGVTPNLNTTATIASIKVWTGAGFTTVGTITDGTDGLTHSGWITWPRVAAAQPSQFQTVQYYSYWYELITATAAISADVIVTILTMPYFDIEELGHGQCNCVWKERVVTSYTLWPNYLYVSGDAKPLSLNGSDFGILSTGDGRRNKVAAIRKFHNELVVWQEEKGHEGGTVTLFQGFTPYTFGKLLISSRIGTMNNKCVAVVDGVLTSTRTDEEVKDLIFFLSRYGVCVTDGMTITIVSDDIQNYFDPSKAECIRRGYESKMWLVHDSAFNIIRIGLVTSTLRSTGTTTSTSANKLVNTAGAFTTDGTAIGDTVSNTTDSTTATITAIDSASTLSIDSDIMTSGEAYTITPGTPNVFPVFDLVDKTWSFDVLAQSLSHMTEIEADSGAIHTIQVGGGVDDGQIYLLNSGDNDVAAAIDAYSISELNAGGEYIQLNEMMIRTKAQTAANTSNITITLYKNSVSAGTKTLSMTEDISGNLVKRHRFNLNLCDQNLSVKIQHNTASKQCELLDLGMRAELFKER